MASPARSLPDYNPRSDSLIRFYLPLAFQFATMNITYPLAGMVASAGEGGAINYAGMQQAQYLMNLISTLGFGMMVTGMVFGRTLEGLRTYQSVNRRLMAAVALIQALVSLTPLSHLMLGHVLGLPAAIEGPAKIMLALFIPCNMLFFTRNRAMVVLYLAKHPAKATFASMSRIALTALLSVIFRATGLSGPFWTALCLTLPVISECALVHYFAKPLIPLLPLHAGPAPGRREIFLFNLPLSVGGFFLNLSTNMLAAFIARAEDPGRMLTIYYLALSLVAPMTFATNQIRTLVLSFPPKDQSDTRTLRFALKAGLILGVIPLLFIIPGPADFYYVNLQKLSPADLPLLRKTALLLSLVPLCTAFRFHSEGLAAWMRRPVTTLAGQAVYLGGTTSAAFIALSLGLAGNLIGPVCTIIASLGSAFTIRLSLNWEKSGPPPAPAALRTEPDQSL